MKISKDDYIRFSMKLTKQFHKWEVLIPFGAEGHMRFRQEKFMPGEFETPTDQYEALCDLINGCRFSDTDYYVFCDDKMVVGL